VTIPDLSVIIVTWNVRELSLMCVRRVLERSPGIVLEVLVVDNASSDHTVEAIRERFPEVRIIVSERNLGFPRANNLALAEARGRHVLFLNPDTEVGVGTLPRCVAELDATPELGAVGCRLVLADGRVQVEGARRHYRLLDLVWEAGYLHVLLPSSRVFAGQVMGEWEHSGVRDVEALSGAFLMARREAALDVGGLPDEVFMYHEDLAFCLRLERAGWGLRYLGDVDTFHHHGAAVGGSTSPLDVLEGEVLVRLIRERSGLLAGLVARVLFGFRSLARLAISLVTWPLPAIRRRHPRVVDVRKYVRHLTWAVWSGVASRALERSGVPIDSRPRLLVIGPTPPPLHGTAMYTKRLANSLLVRSRLRVRHIDTADRRSMDNIGRVDARNVWLGLCHLTAIMGAVISERPAVVYLPTSQNTPAFARDALFILVARLGCERVVTHLHGANMRAFYGEAPALTKWLIRWTHRFVAQAWVHGAGLVNQYEGIMPADRVRVVPNGVLDVYGREIVRERQEEDSLRVLHLGQIGRNKGVDVLLDAVEALASRGVGVHVTVAGPWSSDADRAVLEPRLKGLAERGLAGYVGPLHGGAKTQAFIDADVFVLASRHRYEGQPLAVLEAMCASLPVVATPLAAIPDMVLDGETGVLVAGGSPEELAEALGRLVADQVLRVRLGANARRRFSELFVEERTLARACDQLVALAATTAAPSGCDGV